MALLNAEDLKRIANSVNQAELNTGGEIVTAIIAESDDYAAREIIFGIAVGLITYFVLLFFHQPFEGLLQSWLWMESGRITALAMITLALITAVVAYALAQVPVIDRLVVGKSRMAEAVRRRAMRHFMESAAYDTVDRTGVLLFISVLERRVELIADKGINSQVDPSLWSNIVEELIHGIREENRTDAIVRAVERIGSVLAEKVPPREDDVNEIADAPTELKKGS